MKNMRLYNIQYTHTLVSNKKALQREFVKRRVYGVDVTTLNLLYIYIHCYSFGCALDQIFQAQEEERKLYSL